MCNLLVANSDMRLKPGGIVSHDSGHNARQSHQPSGQTTVKWNCTISTLRVASESHCSRHASKWAPRRKTKMPWLRGRRAMQMRQNNKKHEKTRPQRHIDKWQSKCQPNAKGQKKLIVTSQVQGLSIHVTQKWKWRCLQNTWRCLRNLKTIPSNKRQRNPTRSRNDPGR